jgi:multicomponent Na+:H+ antiporter subunit B
VSRAARTALFVVASAGLGALLVWGLTGLPAFGDYPGPYGDLISNLVKPQRHMANAVSAIVFDYRAFDTLGEELLLFAAATAVALLLRDIREAEVEEVVDAIRSDALRGVGAVGAITGLVLALNVVAHGFVTPGGGFQGGVLLAAGFTFVFLAIEYHAFGRLTKSTYSEGLEAVGAGGYVALGLVSFAFGLEFLENFYGKGVFGRLTSGGSAFLLNVASSLAVAGGFLVIFGEYLQENMAVRYGRSRG